MAIRDLITGGLGNGTFSGSVAKLITWGLSMPSGPTPPSAFTTHSHCFPVTLKASAIGSTLTDFTGMLKLSRAPAGFWSTVKGNGYDVRVTDNSGNTIPSYMIGFSKSGQVGNLCYKLTRSSSTDDVIWVWYGHKQCTTATAVDATYGRDNTWKSDFGYVLAMDRLVDGVYEDHTGQGRYGTPSAAHAGLAGPLVDFDSYSSSTSQVTINGTDAFTETSDFNRFMCCQLNATSGNDGVVSKWTGGANGNMTIIRTGTSYVSTYADSNYHDNTTSDMSDLAAHIIGTRVDSSSNVSTWFDGDESTPVSRTLTDSGDNEVVNAWDTDLTSNRGNQRIAMILRTRTDLGADWWTSWSTMLTDPTDFDTVGSHTANPNYSAPSTTGREQWDNCVFALEGRSEGDVIDVEGALSVTLGGNATVGGYENAEVLFDGNASTKVTVTDAAVFDTMFQDSWSMVVRFNTPYADANCAIVGKWDDTGNQRTWLLYKAGSDLNFIGSSDGSTTDFTLTVTDALEYNNLPNEVHFGWNSSTNQVFLQHNHQTKETASYSSGFYEGTADLIFGDSGHATYGQANAIRILPAYGFSEVLSDAYFDRIFNDFISPLYQELVPDLPAKFYAVVGDSITRGQQNETDDTVQGHSPTPFPEHLETLLIADGQDARVINLGTRGTQTNALGDIFTTHIEGFAYTDILIQMGVNTIQTGGGDEDDIHNDRASFKTALDTEGMTYWDMEILPWKNSAGWSTGDDTTTDNFNAYVASNHLSKYPNPLYVFDDLQDDITPKQLEADYESDLIHLKTAGYQYLATVIFGQLPGDTAIEATTATMEAAAYAATVVPSTGINASLASVDVSALSAIVLADIGVQAAVASVVMQPLAASLSTGTETSGPHNTWNPDSDGRTWGVPGDGRTWGVPGDGRTWGSPPDKTRNL